MTRRQSLLARRSAGPTVCAGLCAIMLSWANMALAQTASGIASGPGPEPGEEGRELPLWELGFGAGTLYGPDYPASSESHLRGLALPYIIYRGDIFRIGDGQTARAVAYESSRLELDLSFAAAFDAKSDDNEMRIGMDDLDFMFQIGPQATIHLLEHDYADDSRGELLLALQARSVFSSDLSRIDQRGYVFEPMLRYRHSDFLVPKLDFTVSLRPMWATARLHSYFYDVDPEFVRPDREAYVADGGYFGTGLNFYANYRINDQFSTFFGIQTTSHHGAANRDSPLHEKDFTAAFGAGFVWSLFSSSQMVRLP